MSQTTHFIVVAKQLNKNYLITETDGELIYQLIKDAISRYDKTVLNFSGIEMSIFRPLHICIGRFFDNPQTIRDFLTHIAIKGDDYMKSKINKVIDNAKQFYSTLDEE